MASRRAKIMVLDDDPEMCRICTRGLQRQGYEVVATTHPQEALDMLQQQEFDLLLLDIRMPEMDGVEVMRRVRQFAPELVIVVLTGYGTMELAIEAIKQGVSDFLLKPFPSVDILKRAVAGALAKRDQARERWKAQSERKD